MERFQDFVVTILAFIGVMVGFAVAALHEIRDILKEMKGRLP